MSYDLVWNFSAEAWRRKEDELGGGCLCGHALTLEEAVSRVPSLTLEMTKLHHQEGEVVIVDATTHKRVQHPRCIWN